MLMATPAVAVTIMRTIIMVTTMAIRTAMVIITTSKAHTFLLR